MLLQSASGCETSAEKERRRMNGELPTQTKIAFYINNNNIPHINTTRCLVYHFVHREFVPSQCAYERFCTENKHKPFSLHIVSSQFVNRKSQTKGNPYLKFRSARHEKFKAFSSLANSISSILFSASYGAVPSFFLFHFFVNFSNSFMSLR